MNETATPALHPAYLRLLALQLRRLGQDLSDPASTACAGGEHAPDEDAPIGIDRVRRAVREALERTGRPWLGLEYGAAVPVLSHGPLGVAAAASGSVREALQLIARFLELRAPLLRLRVETRRDGLWARIEAHGDLQAERLFVLEAALVMLERLLQGLCGREFIDARLEFDWQAPAWARHYSAFFASTLRFGAREAGLWLPNRLADAPCLSADAETLAFARAECERRLASATPRLDFVASLRRRLWRCDGAYPSAAELAAELGMSERSLFRRLAGEGLRWRALLDEVRCARALQMLRETTLPIESIAERLGYADASNFSRCLRRWTGQRASELRGPARRSERSKAS